MSMSMDVDGDGGFKADRGDREPAWDKEIKWFGIPDDNTAYGFRFVAKPYYYAQHWVTSKKKEGTTGKAFPVLCKNYDPATNSFAENGCECCAFMDLVNKAINDAKAKWDDLPKHVKQVARKKTMATNAIVRELQEQGPPANNTGNWSFVVPLRLTQGTSEKIRKLAEKIQPKSPDGVPYAINHKTEGRDLLISFNSQEKVADQMYSVIHGDKKPLTEEELAHSKYLTDFAAHIKYPNQEEVRKSLVRSGYYEWLDAFSATANLKTISREPASQQAAAPRQPAPAQEPAPEPEPARVAPAPVAPAPAPVTPAAVIQAVESQASAVIAQAAPTPVAPAPVQVPVVNVNPVAAMSMDTEVVAPAAAVVPAPVQAPAQQTVGSAAANDIQSRVAAYAQQQGIALKTIATEIVDAQFYKPGMSVLNCFTSYTVTGKTNKPLCKGCPLRLDCMMNDAG